jgi:hypothetical protein
LYKPKSYFGSFLVTPPRLIAPGFATPPGYTLFNSEQFLNTLAAAYELELYEWNRENEVLNQALEI